MPRIFISYRRADSEAVVGRIQERLARAFGGKNVFQDVEDIPPGVDFRQYLNSQVSSCDVELVIIGRQWASVTDDSGNPRLNNPNDFVRIEVEYGLSRDSVTVIPVLVNNASMPPAEELPESLHELLFRNAIPIRNNPDFDRDMERLIYNLRAIDQRDQNVRRKAQRRTLSIVGVVTGLLIVAAFGLIASGIIKLPTGVQPTIDPVVVAQNRVQTLTAEAIAALATPTPNLTGTIDAILTQFVFGTQTAIADNYTDTPTSTYTPSTTPTDSPTPTEDFVATVTMQAVVDAEATQIQATNDALATANAPTNTPQPTETPEPTPIPTLTATITPEPTDSPTPTIDIMGTANAEGTLAAEGTRAVQDAQAVLTQTAQAGLTLSLAPIGRIIVDQDVNLRGDPSTQSGIVAVLEPWTQLVILSTSEDSAWYYVQLLNGKAGWVLATLVDIVGTATPIPLPTMMPTPTKDAALESLTQNHVQRNSDWTPVIRNINGTDMMLVPPGCAKSTYGESNLSYCFQQAFWIDRTEVTVGQFMYFNGDAEVINFNWGDTSPRVDITYAEATEYCVKRGTRLPSDMEWFYSASGPNGYVYPWGNEFTASNAVVNSNSGSHPAFVGSKPGGVSWIGAFDMSGNVWEWVDGTTGIDFDNRKKPDGVEILRGGSWDDSESISRTDRRYIVDAEIKGSTIGFRCAMDYTG